MPYQKALEIEKRLESLLALVRAGRYSTPALARELSTSQPTVSRCLTALRERGYEIQSVRGEDGWHYELMAEPAAVLKG